MRKMAFELFWICILIGMAIAWSVITQYLSLQAVCEKFRSSVMSKQDENK